MTAQIGKKPPPSRPYTARAYETGPGRRVHSVRVSTRTQWPHAQFVKWLDELKVSLGITSDSQLAYRAGISGPSIISNWRLGKSQPDVRNLRKIAQLADVPPVRLYALAGRVADEDMAETPDELITPVPQPIRELIDLYHRSDEPTRVVLLGQVEFLVGAIGGVRAKGGR